MADITISATIDDGSWERAIDAIIRNVEAVTGEASEAAARFVGNVAKAKLSERAHSELTFSPAPPGSPPAMVSGELAGSITTVRSGAYSAMVGPTTKYGRIQELGGPMHGHPYMVFHKFFVDGIYKFKMRFVELDSRPYLKPATRDAVDSGHVRDIYVEYWRGAIEMS